MAKIFSNEAVSSFDEDHKLYVENYLNSDNLFITSNEDEAFDNDSSLTEVEDVIKTLKLKSAPGSDGMKNISIVNLSILGKIHLLRVLNKSWNTGKLPSEWKTAQISMLTKKDCDLSYPNNYRPISLTKCLGKLAEKMIKIRLVNLYLKTS